MSFVILHYLFQPYMYSIELTYSFILHAQLFKFAQFYRTIVCLFLKSIVCINNYALTVVQKTIKPLDLKSLNSEHSCHLRRRLHEEKTACICIVSRVYSSIIYTRPIETDPTNDNGSEGG